MSKETITTAVVAGVVGGVVGALIGASFAARKCGNVVINAMCARVAHIETYTNFSPPPFYFFLKTRHLYSITRSFLYIRSCAAREKAKSKVQSGEDGQSISCRWTLLSSNCQWQRGLCLRLVASHTIRTKIGGQAVCCTVPTSVGQPGCHFGGSRF